MLDPQQFISETEQKIARLRKEAAYLEVTGFLLRFLSPAFVAHGRDRSACTSVLSLKFVRHVKAERPQIAVKQSEPKAHEEEQPKLFERPTSNVVVDTADGCGSKEEKARYKALVLVRNLMARADRIEMGEFVLTRVGLQFEELRSRFSSEDVFQDDWLLEKTYAQLPSYSGSFPSGLGGIPNDIEDTLFLLRLF